jgi:hypothetical protein
MPFGKYVGKRWSDIPIGYLDWLDRQDWLEDDLRRFVTGELRRRREKVIESQKRYKVRDIPLPTAEARTVCGIELDEYDSARFENALETGELVVTLDMPLLSPLETV